VAILLLAEKENDIEFLTGEEIVLVGKGFDVDEWTCLKLRNRYQKKYQQLEDEKQRV